MATASAAGAQSANGQANGNGHGNGNGKGHGLSLAVTPELDSLALFGTGIVSLAGYGALRWRARRK